MASVLYTNCGVAATPSSVGAIIPPSSDISNEESDNFTVPSDV